MSDPISPAPPRLLSLDAYRGFVMFLMAAEMLEVPDVAKHFPDSSFWQCLKFHSEHVAWSGCSLHDMIQPSFSFMVGAALPFSLASRASKGQSLAKQWGHALWRSLVLVLLGVFLRSIGAKLKNWTFEDTLSQIGMGYPFLFALGFATTRVRWIALTALLIGYWLLFALYTMPPEWTAAAANVKASWAHNFTGFAAHWNLNANPAWAFDRWFLNLFPREKPFLGNSGGYCTLNFLPTLGTMLLGLIAGHWMKHRTAPATLISRLLYAGAACLLLGGLLDATGVCPSVKRIWTPAWTLLSGGRCFWLMAAFFGIIDMAGWRRWAFTLVVIGMNSIAMYVLVHTTEKFWSSALDTHLGKAPFGLFGETFRPMLHGALVLMILWMILLWMHRRKLFLRV